MVGLLWTSDQPVAEAFTYRTQHIDIHDPSGLQAWWRVYIYTSVSQQQKMLTSYWLLPVPFDGYKSWDVTCGPRTSRCRPLQYVCIMVRVIAHHVLFILWLDIVKRECFTSWYYRRLKSGWRTVSIKSSQNAAFAIKLTCSEFWTNIVFLCKHFDASDTRNYNDFSGYLWNSIWVAYLDFNIKNFAI
jgi:hypothetical protein